MFASFSSERTSLGGSALASVEEGIGFESVSGDRIVSYALPFNAVVDRHVKVSTYFQRYMRWDGEFDNGEKFKGESGRFEPATYPTSSGRYRTLRSLDDCSNFESRRIAVPAPKERATRISKVDIALAVPTILEVETLEINELQGGKIYKLGTLDVTVKKVEYPSRTRCLIVLAITGTNRFRSVDPDITFYDKMGSVMFKAIPKWEESQFSYDRCYTFEVYGDGSAPASLKISYATRVSWHEYRFTFKNLPLPRGFENR
jgi:hypothetical protein